LPHRDRAGTVQGSADNGPLAVFCARSMHVAVATLARPFGARHGAPPDIVFEPMGALEVRLAAGEAADVLILAAPAIARLDAAGVLLAGSVAAVARAPIGIAIRDGAPAPDVSSADAFAATLRSVGAIALSDPAVGGSAGIYLRDLFTRIGVAEIVAAKTLPQKSGVAAADCVGRGDADIAMSFIPELKQGKGAKILGPLPPTFGHLTEYAAGVTARTLAAEAARAFIACLTAADARATWEAAGFEVP
jgi:molybdate transport system substrate-binding protein